jgi:hypothetical protein
MEYNIIKVILLVLLSLKPANAEDIKNDISSNNSVNFLVPLVPIDKQMHFVVGAGLSRIIAASTGSILIGFVIATTVGGIKELVDQRTDGTPDINDFFATAFGALFVLPFI